MALSSIPASWLPTNPPPPPPPPPPDTLTWTALTRATLNSSTFPSATFTLSPLSLSVITSSPTTSSTLLSPPPPVSDPVSPRLSTPVSAGIGVAVGSITLLSLALVIFLLRRRAKGLGRQDDQSMEGVRVHLEENYKAGKEDCKVVVANSVPQELDSAEIYEVESPQEDFIRRMEGRSVRRASSSLEGRFELEG